MGMGQIVNGTGTGALGQLMRKDVDVFTTGSEVSFHMLPYVDWTYPVLFEKIRIMVPYPEAGRKSNALVAIYSKQVQHCNFWILP